MGLNKNGNGSQQAIIDHRRRQVAYLRLRGATQREIESGLAAQGIINPDTRQPWSLGTINSDIKAMEREWKEAAQKDISEHKARMLAELEETKRAAWAGKDLSIVLRALKQEAELFGLDEPYKVEHQGSEENPIVVKGYVGWSPDEWDANETDS